MKNFVICTIVVSAIIIVASCKKDSNSASNMELITSATWKYDTAMIDLTLDGNPDAALPPGLIEDCDADNTIKLNSDGTGVIDEGATKCDISNPQSVNISWTFSNNETVINIPDTIFGQISGDAQIKILTATKLRLLKQVTVDFGIPTTVNVIVDLKH